MADPAGVAAGREVVAADREAVAAVWRIESARIVGALSRYTGDFALAEDLAQEALAEALVTWPRDGAPRNPVGWLLTVGRRRAIDAFRRRAALDERYAALARDLGEGGATAGYPRAEPARDGADLLWDPDRIDDDVLALMFISCHPLLSREARVALTLSCGARSPTSRAGHKLGSSPWRPAKTGGAS
jgi:predicted RNA polymerase sigma factor